MIELIHTWHWNPSLWPEIRGALGGGCVVIAWPHFRKHRWHQRALAMMSAYIGAPMLIGIAVAFYAYEYFSKERA